MNDSRTEKSARRSRLVVYLSWGLIGLLLLVIPAWAASPMVPARGGNRAASARRGTPGGRPEGACFGDT